jgi:predicted nucleotidyltransferase
MAVDAAKGPELEEKVVQDVVRRILSAGDPLEIVLFGSRARGDAHDDSDVDILIVEASDLPRYRRPARYRRALAGMLPSKDILVWTPAEIGEWENVPNAFINVIRKEGKVLYARP